jgi:undecaprenyl-diphosphatase
VPILHAIVLGIVQGLSEFLPISSSGHLILVPWLFGWDELERSADLKRSFDVSLHVGTFVGAFAYFRADIVRLTRAAVASARRRRIENQDQRLAWTLAVSALPAATVGLALDQLLEDGLPPEWLIGVMLIVFGLLLYAADRLQGDRDVEQFRMRDAVLMGIAQACALQPGVSRSGATMSVGRWLRFDRDAAARLSFLMSLPVIAGAGLYKMADLLAEGIPPGMGPPIVAGMVAAGITGFIAVWGLLQLIRRMTFLPYVVYRVLFGLFVIAVAAGRS